MAVQVAESDADLPEHRLRVLLAVASGRLCLDAVEQLASFGSLHDDVEFIDGLKDLEQRDDVLVLHLAQDVNLQPQLLEVHFLVLRAREFGLAHDLDGALVTRHFVLHFVSATKLTGLPDLVADDVWDEGQREPGASERTKAKEGESEQARTDTVGESA